MIDFNPVAAIADAILYEGYLLYPYRRSALKNRFRWTFGCLLPECCAAIFQERSWFQVECLLSGNSNSTLVLRGRFLHLSNSIGTNARDADVDQLDTPAVSLETLVERPIILQQTTRGKETIESELTVSATVLTEGVYRVRVRLANATRPSVSTFLERESALHWGMLSCHVLLGIEGGAFLSSIAPPAEYRHYAAACENVGLWPVLAGDPFASGTMLAAPIILADYPGVAPESRVNLFDSTEIDEILRLRIVTMTAQEKAEARGTDDRVGQLLEQVHRLPDGEAIQLHGTWRHSNAVQFRPGDRVCLHPGRRADILDRAMDGKYATVVAVEEDLEGRQHVGVVLDDDPGRDLGLAGWPGHRFFFSPQEVELRP
jgi:hypothetical protein